MRYVLTLKLKLRDEVEQRKRAAALAWAARNRDVGQQKHARAALEAESAHVLQFICAGASEALCKQAPEVHSSAGRW